MEIVYKSGEAEYELELRINDQDATLGHLLRVLSPGSKVTTATATVEVEGQPVTAETLLRESGLYIGGSISIGAYAESGLDIPAVYELKVVGGAGAAEWYPIAPGSTVIGRHADCDLVIADRSLQDRHARIDCGKDGSARIRPLGAGLCMVGSEKVEKGGSAPLAPGSSLQLGQVYFEVVKAGHGTGRNTAARVTSGGTIPFNRPPRRKASNVTNSLKLPAEPTERERMPLNLLGLMLNAATPAAMALIYHRATMLAFAAVSPLTGAASWYESRRNQGRKEGDERHSFDAQVADFAQQLQSLAGAEAARRRGSYPNISDLAERALRGDPGLWERRTAHQDFLTFALGVGDVTWEPPVTSDSRDRVPEVLEGILAEHRSLRQVPYTVDLTKNGVVGIYGARADALAVARGLLCQAAILAGPADLSIAVLTDDDRYPSWDWAKWLPHTINATSVPNPRRLIAADAAHRAAVLNVLTVPVESERVAGEAGRTTMVVVDTDVPRFRMADAEAVRATLRGERGPVAGIVLADARENLLGLCTTVLRADPDAVHVEDPGSPGGDQTCRPWGLSERTARLVSRSLARFEDVELPEAGGGVPDDVRVISLLGLDGYDPAAIQARWKGYRAMQKNAGPQGEPELRARIGMAAEGPFEIDVTRHGPHGLAAGMSGSGKSELLSSLIIGLAANVPPEYLTFGLFDFKGGASFRVFEDLPHTVGSLSDLDGALAARALRSLEAELRRRKVLFDRHSVINIRQYHHRARTGGSGPTGIEPMPYLLLVIDEFASMAEKVPTLFDTLDLVAREGRSLGVHMILATQKPAGVISEDVRSNSNLWMCLKVQDQQDSKAVVGVPDAASIARAGRAFIKVGAASPLLIQSALATATTGGTRVSPLEVGAFSMAPDRVAALASEDGAVGAGPAVEGEVQQNDLERLVEMVARAHAAEPAPMPRRPFPEPLGEVSLDELLAEPWRGPAGQPGDHEIVLARADDPDAQVQYPVAWNLKLGNLAIFGSKGSGMTTALIALTLAAGHGASRARQVYLLDFGVGQLDPLQALPYVGAVVGGSDRERQVRLIRMLRDELARRKANPASAGSQPRILLLVDNLGGFRAEYLDEPGGEVLESFNRIFAEGPDAGIHVCVTCEGVNALPGFLTTLVQQRVVLRLADPTDYLIAGVGRDVSPQLNRPGRAWLPDTGLLVQLARPVEGWEKLVGTRSRRGGSVPPRPASVNVLGETVPTHQIAAAGWREHHDWHLPVGISDRDLQPATLNLLEGEHAFIGGPIHCGKSTALCTIAGAARLTVDGCRIVGLAKRASPLSTCPDLDEVCSDEAKMIALSRELGSHQGAVLVLVDDGDRLGDETGDALNSLLALRRDDLHVVAAARPEFLRGLYNHWTQAVRKARTGILLRPNIDYDGDMLAVGLPRRGPARYPAGRGYLVNSGEIDLIQVAITES